MKKKKTTGKNNNPDVFSKLKEDHREVASLFEKVLKTSGKNPEKRAELFDEIRVALTSHAEAEEALFYPKTENIKSTRDLTLEAYEEHRSVKTLLVELEDLDQSSDEWHAKMKWLSEVVKHHVKEEEEELFPKCRKIFDKTEAIEMGEEVIAFEENEIAEQKSA